MTARELPGGAETPQATGKLSAQRSGPASAGAQGQAPRLSRQRAAPQPSRDTKPGSAPGTSPSPRTSAPAPRDRAGCPSLTSRMQRLTQPGLHFQSYPHPPTGLWARKPSRMQKRTLVLTRSPCETSTTRAESHFCLLPCKPQMQAECHIRDHHAQPEEHPPTGNNTHLTAMTPVVTGTQGHRETAPRGHKQDPQLQRPRPPPGGT